MLSLLTLDDLGNCLRLGSETGSLLIDLGEEVTYQQIVAAVYWESGTVFLPGYSEGTVTSAGFVEGAGSSHGSVNQEEVWIAYVQ